MVKLFYPVSCGSFRVTIMDAYGGSAYKDTCITEVQAFSKTA